MLYLFRLSVRFSTIKLNIPFPFQYTLAPQQFAFEDVRFKQLPFTRQFAKPELQHIHFALSNFQNLLNNPKPSTIQQDFIHSSLASKTDELRQILKDSNLDLKFGISTKSVAKSQGYLEIKPEGGASLGEKQIKFIHLYQFERERQILSVTLKPEKQKLTAEEQLKKDLTDQMGENSKVVRQKIQNMQTSKVTKLADRFMDKLMSLGKQKPARKFEPYFIIEQIKGQMNCKVTHEGKQHLQENIAFDSKWLYWVSNLQSEDLKKHRKRTLFDFQFWNRGNFFPVRNFAAEIAHLE